MASFDLSRDVLAEMSGALREIAGRVGLPRYTDDYALIADRVGELVGGQNPGVADSPVPSGLSLTELADQLVDAAAWEICATYLRRTGFDVDPDVMEMVVPEWEREARAAVTAVLDVLVARGVRHDFHYLDRRSLAKIVESLESSHSCDAPVSPSTAVAAGLAVPTGGRDGQPTRQEATGNA